MKTATNQLTLEVMRLTHTEMTWSQAEEENCSNLPVFEIERENYPEAKLHVYCQDYLILELVPGRYEVALYDQNITGPLAELEEQLFDFILKEGGLPTSE